MRPGTWPWLDLLLRQQGGGPAAVNHHHSATTRLRLTVAPRWQMLLPGRERVTLLRELRGDSDRRFPGDGTAADAAGPPSFMLVDRVLNRPVTPPLTLRLEQETIRRLVERTERVSLVDAPGAKPMPQPAGAARPTAVVPPPAPPVRRVVRRAAAVPAEPAPQTAAPGARAPDDGWSLPANRPEPPPGLDAREMDRVTQHVLRTIDRQMWARRERTGRV
jgi:hypothetical protein